MTKYILHGGNVNDASESNKNFYKEVVTSAGKDTVRILCIYFARPEGRWENSYAEDQSSLYAAGLETGVEVNTVLATYEMDDLVENIATSDILYINGGKKGHLRKILLYIPNLDNLIRNKVVVGISAGANILSESYYSSVNDEIRKGIGIIPINLLCHANRDNGKAELFEKTASDKNLYKIEEHQFIVLNL